MEGRFAAAAAADEEGAEAGGRSYIDLISLALSHMWRRMGSKGAVPPPHPERALLDQLTQSGADRDFCFDIIKELKGQLAAAYSGGS